MSTMKKALLLILLLLPIWLLAQATPFAVKAKTKYSASGLFGYTRIDSVKYMQFRYIQEFEIWKIGFGLDLDFLINNKTHKLRPDNWDNLGDIINKFYYIRYAKRGDRYYGHLGGFPGMTLGNGLIMQNYSNMLLYPEFRNTGLMLGMNPVWPTKPNFEVFTSNLEKFQIMSFTANCKPLPDSSVKILDELALGFSIVADRNQYGNLKDLSADSLSHEIGKLDNRAAVVYGFGYTLPFVQTDKVTLGNYAEFSHINDYGSGVILPGIYADFNFLKVNLEYRIYTDKFTPAFFDKYYEEDRGTVQYVTSPIDSSVSVNYLTKESTLKQMKASQGWRGSIQAFVFKKVKAKFAWQNVFGKELNTGKSLWMELWVDSQYKRLENFALSYSKVNSDHLQIRKINEPNASVESSVTIRTYKKKLYLIANYAERYKDKNGDGKVNWAKETKRAWGVGVKVLF